MFFSWCSFTDATQLHDLWNDPAEAHDLSGRSSHAATEVEPENRWNQWMRVTDAPILQGPVPIPADGITTDVNGYSP